MISIHQIDVLADSFFRYMIKVVLGFALIFTFLTASSAMVHRFAPETWLVKYKRLYSYNDVKRGEPFHMVSENYSMVSAPATWYDALYCRRQKSAPWLKQHTQVWNGFLTFHGTEVSSPWLYNYPYPTWAHSCYISGKVCFESNFYVKRCPAYRSELIITSN